MALKNIKQERDEAFEEQLNTIFADQLASFKGTSQKASKEVAPPFSGTADTNGRNYGNIINLRLDILEALIARYVPVGEDLDTCGDVIRQLREVTK